MQMTGKLIYWDAIKQKGKLDNGTIFYEKHLTSGVRDRIEGLPEDKNIVLSYKGVKGGKISGKVTSYTIGDQTVIPRGGEVGERLKFVCPEDVDIISKAGELKLALQAVLDIFKGFGELEVQNEECEKYIQNFECDFRHVVTMGGFENGIGYLEEYRKCLHYRTDVKKAFIHLTNFMNASENNLLDIDKIEKYLSYMDSKNIGVGYKMRTASVTIHNEVGDGSIKG
jgi:hypothetical protein